MPELAPALARELAERYVIEREIGRGGMATVFLARDLRHDRHVALKVLDPELGAVLGSDRFLTEIRTTANLQHPNLLPLFDSGTAAGLLYYVMPFVEGESLRHLLDREKQLPVDDAVRIAIGIANALAYAHARGVIHRDLKPENVLLQSGQPVVADFGIALAVSAAGGARLTQTGLSLGTPQYMSPEQATGDRQIDARSDVYSLGAVLYEMLTGEPPHSGPTVQAVIAKLLTETPRGVRVLRPGVSPHLERVVAATLAKLPADRIPSAERLVAALQERGDDARDAPRPVARRLASLLPWALLAASLALLLPKRIVGTKGDAGTMLTATLPIDLRGLGAAPILSPDARYVAFVGSTETRNRLHIRTLATGQTRAIEGSEGAKAPFFSLDGQWVAYFGGDKLLRVPPAGGRIEELGPAEGDVFRAGAWTTQGEIIFEARTGLHRLPAGGGRITRVPYPSGITRRCIRPVPTPDGSHVACNVGGPAGVEDDLLTFVDLATGARTATTIPMRNPIGFHFGHLIFRQGVENRVMAVKFDAKRVAVEGEPFQLHGPNRGFSLADNGTAIAFEDDGAQRLVMRAGDSTRTVWSPPWPVKSPRLSPDGRSIVVVRTSQELREVWIYDIGTGTSTRLAPVGDAPEWTPDGSRVLYTIPVIGTMGRTPEVRWRRADLGSAEEPLARTDSGSISSGQVAPDGRSVVLWIERLAQGLWRTGLDAESPVPLVSNEGTVIQPRLSGDGRWIAYATNESGQTQVVVRPFGAPGARVTISDDGGIEPVWDRRGEALFYRSGNEFIRASLSFTPTPRVTGRSVVLRGAFGQWFDTGYDVTPDGQRLLVAESISGGQLVIVVNWLEELRRRAK
jgi:serine/threonine-protein kinase